MHAADGARGCGTEFCLCGGAGAGWPVRPPPCQDGGGTRTGEETMGNGLLFACFDFTPAHEDEFHDWYDLEHIPERLRVPGFLNAERWIADENPKIAVATYDLESPGVLHSDAVQCDRLGQRLSVDQARHRHLPPPAALRGRADGARQRRRAVRRRRAAGGDDERRSRGRGRIQRVVQQRAPAAARRGARRAVRAPLPVAGSTRPSGNTWHCTTWPIRTSRAPTPGGARRIPTGRGGCARISATRWCFVASATSAPARRRVPPVPVFPAMRKRP